MHIGPVYCASWPQSYPGTEVLLACVCKRNGRSGAKVERVQEPRGKGQVRLVPGVKFGMGSQQAACSQHRGQEECRLTCYPMRVVLATILDEEDGMPRGSKDPLTLLRGSLLYAKAELASAETALDGMLVAVDQEQEQALLSHLRQNVTEQLALLKEAQRLTEVLDNLRQQPPPVNLVNQRIAYQ